MGKDSGTIKTIPNNEEKYISFSKEIVVGSFRDKKGKEKFIKHEIRFIDSYKFIQFPLADLVKNLSPEHFVFTKKAFGEKHETLTRKGVDPYDWMNSFEKFEKRCLPPREEFYSKLYDEEISEKDYEFPKKVNMGEYHDIYLTSDVVLLADLFEQFRKTCLEYYGLDPAWYFASPGLAWDALLKHSEAKLELLTDPDMLLLFEQGTRGGISTVTHRFGKANNKYMNEAFVPEEPSKFLAYLDANNLYGWAMIQRLPVAEFSWMNKKELENWREIPCVLEVDLEYPKELHDSHNDYPLAPESLQIGKVRKLAQLEGQGEVHLAQKKTWNFT